MKVSIHFIVILSLLGTEPSYGAGANYCASFFNNVGDYLNSVKKQVGADNWWGKRFKFENGKVDWEKVELLSQKYSELLDTQEFKDWHQSVQDGIENGTVTPEDVFGDLGAISKRARFLFSRFSDGPNSLIFARPARLSFGLNRYSIKPKSKTVKHKEGNFEKAEIIFITSPKTPEQRALFFKSVLNWISKADGLGDRKFAPLMNGIAKGVWGLRTKWFNGSWQVVKENFFKPTVEQMDLLLEFERDYNLVESKITASRKLDSDGQRRDVVFDLGLNNKYRAIAENGFAALLAAYTSDFGERAGAALFNKKMASLLAITAIASLYSTISSSLKTGSMARTSPTPTPGTGDQNQNQIPNQIPTSKYYPSREEVFSYFNPLDRNIWINATNSCDPDGSLKKGLYTQIKNQNDVLKNQSQIETLMRILSERAQVTSEDNACTELLKKSAIADHNMIENLNDVKSDIPQLLGDYQSGAGEIFRHPCDPNLEARNLSLKKSNDAASNGAASNDVASSDESIKLEILNKIRFAVVMIEQCALLVDYVRITGHGP